MTTVTAAVHQLLRRRSGGLTGSLLCVAGAALTIAGCRPTKAAETAALFESLGPGQTGIAFVNELPEAPEFNILNYLYYYNGGGVAVGDVDGDGLPDLYFTSNLGPNRLYRNKGNYQFEDITDRAGVAGSSGWTSGVTMADVNGDGHVDIYVSAVSYLTMSGRNILYINNGDGTFSDSTEAYGLSHVGYSTQALFFDYDRDGDLDMYLLNNSTHTERGVSSRPQREPRHPRAGDKLFRNDGNRFVDVSAEAGIHGGVEGYGLGVVASDLNLNGCPDLYVANDFQENDFLYYNNCDGTFTEALTTSMAHTSRFSMGVDAADFDNDGRPDVVVLDMLPEREEILKSSANAEGFNLFNLRLKAGYHPQYARNTLQLNRGAGRFSEIGYLAGVYATDWSWAALFADLDNDGHKDLYITNGIYRRPNDLDYINYVGNDAVQASLARGVTPQDLTLLERMPQIPLANYAYRNNGDLTFSSVASEWGLAQPGFSNGAVYVDLTNSGSLDLVVNNINAPASIYRNRARERNGNHYLKVQLRGSGANTAGIGAMVTIRYGGRQQMLEQNPTRGFQSSVDPRLHFGLGAATRIDTLTVVWPDQRYQVLTNLASDQILTLSQSDAGGAYARPEATAVQPLFRVESAVGLDFRHRENVFFDYNREPLMPHLLSTEGPALAVGDVNGDGLDDVYVGGAKWQAGAMYFQQPDGTFRASSQPAFRDDSVSEDVNAILFDANGNGHLDLYVVSGGNEFWGNQEPLRDRLYMNDGRGNFRRARDALPDFFENGSAVAAGDFNGDGHLDLFVGSRVVAREYGSIPRSRLLQNDGSGRFADVTAAKAPSLSTVGMVTSAAWGDLSGDGRLELVVVGEWMPVSIFGQENGRFVDRTADAGLSGSNGWWNAVVIADLTGDGRGDLILGNLGLNSYIRASREEPAQLHIADFARNGAMQQLLTFYKNGVSYPVAGRDEILRLNPQLRSRYPSYASFGAARLEDIFAASELRSARVLNAYTFGNSVALNDGRGRFTLQLLPTEAQFAPVYAAVAEDFDGDGRTDLLLAGNFHGVTPMFGWYDAGLGIVLRGRGDGSFDALDMENSGLVLGGQVRRVAQLAGARGSRALVAARNDSTVQIVRWNRRQPPPVASAR